MSSEHGTPGSGSPELAWFKSSYSGNEGGECVEVAATAGTLGAVHVRDSKDRSGPTLAFPADAWAAFLAQVSSR